MNRILAAFVFLIFASSITAVAEEQAKPQPSSQSSTASQPQDDKKASGNPPKEEVNIIDFCRTHTC